MSLRVAIFRNVRKTKQAVFYFFNDYTKTFYIYFTAVYFATHKCINKNILRNMRCDVIT